KSALRNFVAYVKSTSSHEAELDDPAPDRPGDSDDVHQDIDQPDPAADTQTAEEAAESAADQAELEQYLAQLSGPYHRACATDGPEVPKLKELFDQAKLSMAKQDYDQAAESVGALTDLLGKQTNSPAPVPAGMDGAPLPAAGPGLGTIVEKGLPIAEKIWD